MTTNLAGAASRCTGTWSQQWKCGWNQPTTTAASTGHFSGHSVIPALLVLIAVLLLVRAVRKRRKGRASAPAAAGARR